MVPNPQKIKIKKKELDFNNPIMKISLGGERQSLLGITQAKSISLISSEKFQIKGNISASKEIFFSADFRKKDGRVLSISGKNKKIDLIDVRKKSILRSLKGHFGPVYSTDFSHDGLSLISAGNDRFLKSWDISLQKCIFSGQFHKDSVRSVSFFPESNQICGSSSYDGTVRVFDLRILKPIVKSFTHGCPVECFDFLPYNNSLVSIGGNFVKCWDISQDKLYFQIKETKPLCNLTISSDKTILYSPIGQEINLFDISHLVTYPLFCFENEITTTEKFSNGIYFGFSDGKICIKNFDKRLKNFILGVGGEKFNTDSLGLSNFLNLNSSLGFKKKKKNLGLKKYDLDKFKIVFSRKGRKKNFAWLSKSLKSINLLLKKNLFRNVLELLVTVNDPILITKILSDLAEKMNPGEILSWAKPGEIMKLVKIFFPQISLGFKNENLFFLKLLIEIDLPNKNQLFAKTHEIFFVEFLPKKKKKKKKNK
mmetsp:Transcript_50942/g.103569  ORF Transcript_50942/g.103569 Transcript_50942/m.103569 type:complete len:482 (+) Transcript_50942:670-2115(+)